ncbi:MAG: Holliday junction branch migration protein RuvA [Patescibacteria group bacterium]
MIYSIVGNLVGRGDNFLVVETGGVGFKISTNSETLSSVPQGEIKLFCYLYVREDQLELYGFLEEQALKFFEMLNSVSGIGPKTALGILDMAPVPKIMAAILERRADFLTRASGIGKKTAERLILELHSKIKLPESQTLTSKMDMDIEVEEALVSLGYPRSQVKDAVRNLGEAKTLEERLREALKFMGKRK